MAQIFFVTYLVLGLLATLLLWTTLVASRMHDIEEGENLQRVDRTALAVSSFKNARVEPDLLEEPVS